MRHLGRKPVAVQPPNVTLEAVNQGTDPRDDNSIELVYSEIRDLLRRQESKLREARARAGTVLAVAAFALSFLGGAILEGDTRPGRWFWACG